MEAGSREAMTTRVWPAVYRDDMDRPEANHEPSRSMAAAHVHADACGTHRGWQVGIDCLRG